MKRMIVLLALVAAIAALCAATAWAWGAAHPDSTWRYNERSRKSFRGHELMIHDALLMLKSKGLLPPGVTDNWFAPLYTSGTPTLSCSWGYYSLLKGTRVADYDVAGGIIPYISSWEHYYLPYLPFLTAPVPDLPGGGWNAKTAFMCYINGGWQQYKTEEPGAIARFKNAVTKNDTIAAFEALGYAIHYLEDGSMPFHMEWPGAAIPHPHGCVDDTGDAIIFNERLTYEQEATNRSLPYGVLAFGGDAVVKEDIIGGITSMGDRIGYFNHTQNMNDFYHSLAKDANAQVAPLWTYWNNNQSVNWTGIKNSIRPLMKEGEDRIALLMYYVFWKAGYYHGASNPPSVTGGPTVFVRTPGDGSMVYNNNAYTIKADIADGHGVNKAEFFANGILLGSKNAAPWTWDWSPSSTKAVNCAITVKAYGNGGAGDTTSAMITVTKGADSYYNKLNVGGSVGVIDPKDGHTATCVLTNVVSSGTRYAVVTVDGLAHTVNAGQMVKVNNGNSGLFIYVATIFDGSERFSELMIAPYQYPNLDIIVPEAGASTNSTIAKVATNYSGKNIPWQGIGNPPVWPDALKTLNYGAGGTTNETYTWTMSGANGPRTLTVSLTDKLGAVVSKSVTVNYDSSIPFYIYRGPYGDDWKTSSLSIGNRTWESVNIAQYYYCNTGDWLGGDYSAFSRQEVISKIAAKIGGIGDTGPLTQGAPAGSLPVWVVDKNQYTSGTFSAEKFGTIYWKEVYQALAGMLGKDNTGKYRVWASVSAAGRSSTDAIPSIDLPDNIPGPTYPAIGKTSITIACARVTGAIGYTIKRGVGTSPSSWTDVKTLDGESNTNYTDTLLSPNTTYSYKVLVKAQSPSVDKTSQATVVTTTNSDGVLNGNFENPGGWCLDKNGINSGGSHSPNGWDPGWSFSVCGAEYWNGAICSQQTSDPAHHYYGYVWLSVGCGSASLWISNNITVPSDATTLKFDAWSSGGGSRTVTFGSLTLSNPSAASWQQYSFDVQSYRGQNKELRACVSGSGEMNGSIGIDNVMIIGTPPTVSISAPASGASVKADTITTISATASDLAGINRVEFYVDGTAIGQDFASPYTCNWIPRIAKSYSIMAKAYDKSGNTNTHTITVTATGIVGYWKLDAITGAIATDNSGNDNNGLLVNGATWVAGQVNNCLSFDGVDDYVEISSSTVGTGNEMTISLWTKPYDQIAGSWGYHNDIIRSGCYGSGGWSISTADSFNRNSSLGFQICWITGTDYWWVPPSATVTKNSWNHLVLVLNRNTGKATFYRNGAFVVETTVSVGSKPNTTGLRIGGDCGGTVKALIDEVRIYNRALSADEVQTLRMHGSLVANWKLDETSGSTASDVSGNNNIGTLTNMDPATDWVTGQYGKALDFDGSNDYVAVLNSAKFNLTQLTIAMWIKTPASFGGNYRNLLSKQNASYDRDYNLYAYSSDGTKVTALHLSSTRFGSAQFNLTTAYSASTWHHVAVTIDQNGLHKYYSDGVLLNSYQGTAGNANSSYPIWIGRGDNYWKGVIDEVRIYNQALSAAEITAIKNNTKVAEESAGENDEYSELETVKTAMPKATQLLSCAPNPFTGQTTISFQLAKSAQTSIVVYNITGQKVKVLINECLRPGYHSVKWDGKDASGNKVSAGVYLYRMQAGDYSKTNKMTVFK